jgi:hypothetical protein
VPVVLLGCPVRGRVAEVGWTRVLRARRFRVAMREGVARNGFGVRPKLDRWRMLRWHQTVIYLAQSCFLVPGATIDRESQVHHARCPVSAP